MTRLALEVQWVMGLLFWVLLLLCWEASCDGSGLSVRLTEFPNAVSHRNTTAFSFEPLVNGNVEACSDCKFSCKVCLGSCSTVIFTLAFLPVMILLSWCVSCWEEQNRNWPLLWFKCVTNKGTGKCYIFNGAPHFFFPLLFPSFSPCFLILC